MNIKQHWQTIKNAKHTAALVFIFASILVHTAVILSSVTFKIDEVTVYLPTQASLQIDFIGNTHKPARSSATATDSKASTQHHKPHFAKQLKKASNQSAQSSTKTIVTQLFKQDSKISSSKNLLTLLDTAQNNQATNQDSTVAVAIKYGTDHNTIDITSGNSASITTANKEQNAAINQKILKRVHNELQKYIVYPVMARQRGWAGLVLVGFQFNDAGLIRNIHLSKSSGYPILDQSALNAFQQITDTQFADALRTDHWRVLQLPIEFRLVEG